MQGVTTTATIVVAAVRLRRGPMMQYLEFSNMKPPKFRDEKVLIIDFRWISDMKGCFYMFSYPTDQNVKFTLNLLHWGAKDWWDIVNQTFLHVEQDVVS